LRIKKAFINTDGAARGNPGPAAIGVVIKDEQGSIIDKISRRIGVTTNNQAEYKAIIAALEKATGLGIRHIDLKTDSELVVKQINGQYRVKNQSLQPLYEKVKTSVESLEGFTITHVPREKNTEADALANKAFNSK
jgi:ribonuclease HI